MAYRGYYSLIQFCPDASRAEAANVGVILLCPDLSYLGHRLAAGNDRVRRFFRSRDLDLEQVNQAKGALRDRLETAKADLLSPEALAQFAATRANALVVTPPRPVRVDDAEAELAVLFEHLVGGRGARRPPSAACRLVPELDQALRGPDLAPRLRFDVSLEVPVIGRPITFPYAYQNGLPNYILPKAFHPTRPGLDAAMALACEGDLIQKRATGAAGCRVIVIPVVGDGPAKVDTESRIASVMHEYQVRTVLPADQAAFIAEVREQAHV